MNAVTAIPSSAGAWARYCIDEGLSLREYAVGFTLLQGPEAPAWLERGFEALADYSRRRQS